MPEISNTRIAPSEIGRLYFDRSSRAVTRAGSRSPRSLSVANADAPCARTKVKPAPMWMSLSQGVQSIGRASAWCVGLGRCRGGLPDKAPGAQADRQGDPEDDQGQDRMQRSEE